MSHSEFHTGDKTTYLVNEEISDISRMLNELFSTFNLMVCVSLTQDTKAGSMASI